MSETASATLALKFWADDFSEPGAPHVRGWVENQDERTMRKIEVYIHLMRRDGHRLETLAIQLYDLRQFERASFYAPIRREHLQEPMRLVAAVYGFPLGDELHARFEPQLAL